MVQKVGGLGPSGPIGVYAYEPDVLEWRRQPPGDTVIRARSVGPFRVWGLMSEFDVTALRRNIVYVAAADQVVITRRPLYYVYDFIVIIILIDVTNYN